MFRDEEVSKNCLSVEYVGQVQFSRVPGESPASGIELSLAKSGSDVEERRRSSDRERRERPHARDSSLICSE
jgi:hypothetical protein